MYPAVMSEHETLDAIAARGVSCARFGDGELQIVNGNSSVSQEGSPALRDELRAILASPNPSCLPCVPHPAVRGVRGTFERYFTRQYSQWYTARIYGSSFITRPECAPWIDRSEYWEKVRALWRGKRVAYVSGDPRLLSVIKPDVPEVEVYIAPRKNAYAVIGDIHNELRRSTADVAVIALGAAGTVLAARASVHMQSLDLGHIGMFMENPGAFQFSPDDLVSPEYRAELRKQHTETYWGKGGHSWAPQVIEYARAIGASDILDYGCGRGTLKPVLKDAGFVVHEYDPGIPGKDAPPKLADLVVSTDVFEHIEPSKLDAVLTHTFRLARKAAFFVVAKQPAKKILSDGRNAHLLCQEDAWWTKRLTAAGWPRVKVTETSWKKFTVRCEK